MDPSADHLLRARLFRMGNLAAALDAIAERKSLPLRISFECHERLAFRIGVHARYLHTTVIKHLMDLPAEQRSESDVLDHFPQGACLYFIGQPICFFCDTPLALRRANADFAGKGEGPAYVLADPDINRVALAWMQHDCRTFSYSCGRLAPIAHIGTAVPYLRYWQRSLHGIAGLDDQDVIDRVDRRLRPFRSDTGHVLDEPYEHEAANAIIAGLPDHKSIPEATRAELHQAIMALIRRGVQPHDLSGPEIEEKIMHRCAAVKQEVQVLLSRTANQ